MRYRLLPIAISIILAIVPFFWLKPGWIDIGGDSSRLYFYDPVNYLKSFPLYGVAPDGLAGVNTSYYLIPFVSFLLVLKKLLGSSYLLITLFNSMQLVVAFLSVFFIIKELLRYNNSDTQEPSAHVVVLIATIAGLFYTFSPFLTPNGWDKAMFIHNQFFLNPFMFLLLLKFFSLRKTLYGISFLLVSFLFAPNFSPSPSVFAFYPLALLYLFLFTKMAKGVFPSIKTIVLGMLMFFVIHFFHLFPYTLSFLSDQANVFYQAAFSEEGKLARGLGYFTSVAQTTRFLNNILSLPQGESSVIAIFEIFWFVFPILTIVGLLFNRSRQTLLLAIFFLISLFLVTAKVTNIGFSFYQSLFNLPGFGMFRNYVGQFSFVFIFFYTLLFAHALFPIFSRLEKPKVLVSTTALLFLIVTSSIPFLRGDMVNLVINKVTEFNFSKPQQEVSVSIKMDPTYEKVLEYIRENPIDAKYLTLPFTEAGLQMVAGLEGGAYQGPSTIAYLTSKKDFSGYQVMLPFSEQFLKMAKEKNYTGINHLLSLLNIKYIFYNSDPYIYTENFPGVPYSKTYGFLPGDQASYTDFIENLATKKKIDFEEKYHLYEVDDALYLPHLFVAKRIAHANSEEILFSSLLHQDKRTIVIYQEDIAQKNKDIVDDIYLIPAKESEFLGTQMIASSVTSEQYILVQPLVLLQQWVLRFGTNPQENRTFDDSNSPETKAITYSIKPLFGGTYQGYVEKVDNENYIQFGGIELKEKQANEFTLSFEQPNLAKQLQDEITSEEDASYIIRETMLNIIHDIVRLTSVFDPNTTYFFSFDYLISQTWKTYKAVVETDSVGKEGFLKLLTVSDSMTDLVVDPTVTAFSIRNIFVYKFENPAFFLKQIRKKKADTEIPKITFRKINPTKYEIRVKDANDPYTLVLQDAFSKYWDAYILEKKEDEAFSVVDYFNGDIKEGKSENIFFSPASFETWGKRAVSKERHFSVNGYANAWLIEPEDADGATEYTVILELKLQRFFYIASFISLMGVFVCLAWLIMLSFSALHRRILKA